MRITVHAGRFYTQQQFLHIFSFYRRPSISLLIIYHYHNTYKPVSEDDMGGSHTFNVDNYVFNITKIKLDGTLKTRAVSELSELSNKLDFYIGKRQS